MAEVTKEDLDRMAKDIKEHIDELLLPMQEELDEHELILRGEKQNERSDRGSPRYQYRRTVDQVACRDRRAIWNHCMDCSMVERRG